MNLVRCNNGHFYDSDKFAVCPHCSGGNQAMGGMGNQAMGGMGNQNMGFGGYSSTSEETVAYDAPQGFGGSDNTVGETWGMGNSSFTEKPTEAAPTFGDPFPTPTPAAKPAGSPSLNQLFENSSSNVNAVFEEDDDVTKRYDESVAREPVVGWLVAISGEAKGTSYILRKDKNFIGRSDSMDVVIKGDQRVSRNKHAIVVYESKNKLFMVQPGESRELFYLNGNVVLNTETLKAYDRILIGETELLFIPLCGEQFSWDENE